MHLDELTKAPSLNYKIPHSFFNLVNFTPVIQHIHNIVVDKISEFDSEIKITNRQHKKYIYHYFIHHTCEILKYYNNKVKPVIYFDTSIELNNRYEGFLRIFENNFPVILLREDISLNKFKKRLKCDGYRDELRIILMRKLKKNQSKSFYFTKLQYFCKKYDLTFLDKTYFEDIRNKLSLL
jgi:hypothetical protein